MKTLIITSIMNRQISCKMNRAMKVRMRLVIGFVAMLMGCLSVGAQSVMRVTQKDGTHVDIPVSEIDSISFVSADGVGEHEVSLVGTWKWESREAGYSETLTFNADGSFTCLDHYFDYDADAHTYGTYRFFGAILNLLSNGYGYRQLHQWMVTELTEQRLTVMTKMGSFTYIRQAKRPNA